MPPPSETPPEPVRPAPPSGAPARWAERRARLSAWAQSERGRRVLTWARRAFNVVILAAIAWQLTRIGWGEVWATMPTNPWFYALIPLGYAALPTAETLIYGRLWGLRPRESFPALLKKRIYNQFVVEYSGEVYLYWWARRATGRPQGQIARDVRDVNILSNAASVLVAVTLFGGLLAAGRLDLAAVVGDTQPVYWGAGAFLAALVVALAARFRKHLFALPLAAALTVLAIHVGQVLTIYAIKLGQWTLGVPGVGVETWLVFLAAAVALERLPFIPSKDFVFIGASVGLARAVEVNEAAVAGMLLVATLGGQALHLLVYLWVTAFERRR